MLLKSQMIVKLPFWPQPQFSDQKTQQLTLTDQDSIPFKGTVSTRVDLMMKLNWKWKLSD